MTAKTERYGGFSGRYTYKDVVAVKSVGYDEDTNDFRFIVAWKTECKEGSKREFVDVRCENRKIMMMSILTLIFGFSEVRYAASEDCSKDFFLEQDAPLENCCLYEFLIDLSMAEKFEIDGGWSDHWGRNATVKIPEFTEIVFEKYFSLPKSLKQAFVNSCHILELSQSFYFSNRNLSIMLSMTAIEGLITADFINDNGKGDESSIGKVKYVGSYIEKFLVPSGMNKKIRGKLREEFRELYKKRCEFVHNADVLESDIFVTNDAIAPLCGEKEQSDARLALDGARLCLLGWLCFPERKPEIKIGEKRCFKCGEKQSG